MQVAVCRLLPVEERLAWCQQLAPVCTLLYRGQLALDQLVLLNDVVVKTGNSAVALPLRTTLGRECQTSQKRRQQLQLWTSRPCHLQTDKPGKASGRNSFGLHKATDDKQNKPGQGSHTDSLASVVKAPVQQLCANWRHAHSSRR